MELKAGLEGVEDSRRTNGRHILHKLEDIIIIELCTAVCGGEDFPDMEEFRKEREEWLGKFLELPHGIPDSDTFRRVFERINARWPARQSVSRLFPVYLSSCSIPYR